MRANLSLEAFRLPRSVPIVKELAGRGVALVPRAGEDGAAFQIRIETELMALFRDTRGEAEFQALYDYAGPELLSWITSLPRAPGRCADPVETFQDTCVNVYRYARSFRSDEAKSFRVWSRTIARNLHRRSQRRWARFSLQALPEGLQEPVDDGDTPLQTTVLREDAGTLSRAWALLLLQYLAAWRTLSERDRLALELVEAQGLSYAEAGRRLRVGPSNMKMIMFRARKRLCATLWRTLCVSHDLRAAV